MISTENGERVIRSVPVPGPDDADGNPPGSFEFLFVALGGGIPPLPVWEGQCG